MNTLSTLNGVERFIPQFLYRDIIILNLKEWRRLVKEYGDVALYVFPLMLGKRGSVCIEWGLLGRN